MSRSSRGAIALAALGLAASVKAHCSVFHKSIYGLNWPYQSTDTTQNWNNNIVVNPLRQSDNLSLPEWWAHNMTGYPPKPGDVFELVSGSMVMIEISDNRSGANATRDPSLAGQPLYEFAADGMAMHQMNPLVDSPPPDPKWLGGTAIAIAYQNRTEDLTPDDFVVITANRTSVFYREQYYEIPAKMPPCNGVCKCSWHWIHEKDHGEGYGQEMYQTLFDCIVTGDTDASNTIPLGSGTLPVLCEDDISTCNNGPKKPMFLFMAEGNNMPDPGDAPNPSYNYRYGFNDGAQAVFPGQTVVPTNASNVAGSAPTASGSTPGASSVAVGGPSSSTNTSLGGGGSSTSSSAPTGSPSSLLGGGSSDSSVATSSAAPPGPSNSSASTLPVADPSADSSSVSAGSATTTNKVDIAQPSGTSSSSSSGIDTNSSSSSTATAAATSTSKTACAVKNRKRSRSRLDH